MSAFLGITREALQQACRERVREELIPSTISFFTSLRIVHL
jgi:hypothetical protein